MIYQYFLRFVCLVYGMLLRIFSILPPHRKVLPGKSVVLVTGTFYSDNWLTTHLKPLAMSDRVSVVKMVSVAKVPEMENVIAVYPPERLINFIGKVPARLIYFAWLALKTRPDYLMAFHLLINGMVAIMMAKIIGARSIYICGGGPREVEGGGIGTESKIFNRLRKPDNYIEKKLIEAVAHCDLVVTMGKGAEVYFRSRGVDSRIVVVPGGFDSNKFQPSDGAKKYDLILIGRISKVKRIDIFLRALKVLRNKIPDTKAVIVGDGPDRNELESLCEELGLSEAVTFAGWQKNVGDWISASRVFSLTSESEGLSQAMMQAMMAGLPAVVTDVGDLSDLVVNGRNGCLVKDLEPEQFAQEYFNILGDLQHERYLKDNAYADTRKYSYERVADQWNGILKKG